MKAANAINYDDTACDARGCTYCGGALGRFGSGDVLRLERQRRM